MKYTRSFLAVLVLSLTILASNIFAQTNTNAPTAPTNAVEQAKGVVSGLADTAKHQVETNINQVMIEMLSGVKDASGEVYHFSKQEIGKGYDFAKEQAPQVVHEFLMWQAVKSIVWILIWSAVAVVLFYLTHKARLWAEKSKEGSEEEVLGHVGKWIFRLAALTMLIVVIGSEGLNIAKIAVAPRVYIIEYVMDLYHGQAADYR